MTFFRDLFYRFNFKFFWISFAAHKHLSVSHFVLLKGVYQVGGYSGFIKVVLASNGSFKYSQIKS
ncbi:hypothetical protein, partial [Vibrio parahaemolyticus]|uniref:hypothetical protein n=1 Tax=Vibrio parahaemolyticus TaxID=670 RepID=UPI001C5F1D8A